MCVHVHMQGHTSSSAVHLAFWSNAKWGSRKLLYLINFLLKFSFSPLLLMHRRLFLLLLWSEGLNATTYEKLICNLNGILIAAGACMHLAVNRPSYDASLLKVINLFAKQVGWGSLACGRKCWSIYQAFQIFLTPEVWETLSWFSFAQSTSGECRKQNNAKYY